MRIYNLTIPSMHNETSAKEIKSVLTKVNGIKNIDLNYEETTINIYCEDILPSFNEIKLSIENKGYLIKED